MLQFRVELYLCIEYWYFQSIISKLENPVSKQHYRWQLLPGPMKIHVNTKWKQRLCSLCQTLSNHLVCLNYYNVAFFYSKIKYEMKLLLQKFYFIRLSSITVSFSCGHWKGWRFILKIDYIFSFDGLKGWNE